MMIKDNWIPAIALIMLVIGLYLLISAKSAIDDQPKPETRTPVQVTSFIFVSKPTERAS